MENAFNISKNLVLLGLEEMEGLKYLYCALSIVLYSFILLSSITIVAVVVADTRLHEPMYILICNLVLNGIFGSSLLFPKLLVDLITSSTTITHGNCIAQAACVALFAFIEMSTFILMAFDRYLAVCHPLRYNMLVTNERIISVIIGSYVVIFILTLIGLLLTGKLPLCGNRINNIFCDNMSMVILSCVDSSVSQLYATSVVGAYLCFTIFITIFSNLQIFLVCLKITGESRQKAVHTLVTHLLNLSIFLLGVLFIFIRYRLGSIKLPIIVHVLLSVTTLIVPPLFNPLIYGVRTNALKMRVIHHLQTVHVWSKWTSTQKHFIPLSVISHSRSRT
ncbi:olfactory receptor 4C6-like [Dendropsophus ebraccatus]|uniref:olfactory receptor 4C6-like n=1 Tax=Dendropsophus ebraccatus TaxID=150705 RepID=UPI00383232A5